VIYKKILLESYDKSYDKTYATLLAVV